MEMIEEETLQPAEQVTRNDSISSPNRFWRYGPLVVWAALIFIGSSDLLSASHTSAFLAKPLHWLLPNADEATLRTIHFMLRKAGHFTEYAILAFFAQRAFRTSSHEFLRRRWFWVSLLLMMVYSLSDEFHQSFVATRTPSIYDSMIDTLGGLVALTMVWWWGRRIGKRETRRANTAKAGAAA